MTNEYRRLAGSRACFIPLLISIAFAVGYLMGHRSPVQSAIVEHRSPGKIVNANGPRKIQRPAQSGNVRQDPRQYPSTLDQPRPNAVPDIQNASPSRIFSVVHGTPPLRPVEVFASSQSGRSSPVQESQSNLSHSAINAPPVNVASGGPVKTVTKSIPVAPTKVTVKPGPQTLEYEMVISHYNEPLDWLRPYADHSHVYHKGSDRGPPFAMYKWERIPNVGREPHTYLHHIINNYDHLADLTVFMQGHGTSKDQSWCYTPMEFITNAKSNIFCKNRGSYHSWGRINHFGKWLAELSSGRMRRAKTTVGEFYTALFGTQPPPSVPRCLAGCFSATRENLRLHPLSFYQKAITFVNDHSNPEEAHYFERLWGAIINAK
ncbi:uncharacterized protein LOC119725936 isoform X2 [Patiria miniata]|uniref:Uncharacterized protein n=1 Tax=Patiria miniata TaxID=46514 RepID=A0A913ZP27_PATMI|nr:uncharacterized protein LOC119725936 isoform X2 [Patiria miniata]